MSEARVLLVESDPQVRVLLRRFLARSGHALVEATDAAAALPALEGEVFDVVILRMNLSDGRAAEVLEGARLASGEPSVILTGSKATADTFARSVDCVGAIFLVKPFGGRDLARALDDGLAQRRVVIDSAPAEELDFEAMFDGVDASLGPAPSPPQGITHPPVDPFSESSLLLAGASRGGLLDPPSMPPPRVVPPSLGPAASVEAEDLGSLLGDPVASQTGDLLGPPEASESEAAYRGPLPRESAHPEPARATDESALERSGPRIIEGGRQLFGSSPGDDWGLSGGLEARPQASELPPEDEAAYRLRPLVADGPDDPRGTYGELGLPQLLVSCARDLFTGRLTLQRGAVRKVILFAGGMIIDSLSNLRAEELGPLLLRQGRIDEPRLRALDQHLRSAHLTAEAGALALGLLTEDALQEARAQLAQERLFGCFTWIGGEYGVTDDARLQEQPPPMQLDPVLLVARAALEILPTAPMLGHFDTAAQRSVERTSRFDAVRAVRQAVPLLGQLGALCDGRSFAAVVAASPVGLTATLRALRALQYLQAIRFTDAARPAARSDAGHVTAEDPSTPSPDRQDDRPVRHSTGERLVYRHSTGSERPGPFDDAPASGSLDIARRDSRSARALRDPGGRRSGIYRSGATEPSRPPQARDSRRPSGVLPPVRRATGEQRPVSSTPSARPSVAPAVTSTPARPADVAALKRRLQTKHASLGTVDHYTLLEIEPTASAEEVRAAYQALSRQMHQAAAHDARLAPIATEVGRRLAEAASILSNRRQRAQYDAVHGSRASTAPVERDLEGAEQAFSRGRACLDRGDFPDAFDFFDQASRLAPDRPLHRMYRAYATFRLSYPKHRKAAVEAHDDLKKALLEDATQDEGFLLMAHIYRETGNLDMAVKFYRKALSLNRKSRPAAEALAQIAPGGDGVGGGSLFGRLFKR